MLKRIYIDNYKCLVNFETTFSSLNLILGPNGAGKSTVFEVFRKLIGFISGDFRLDKLFENTSRTVWQTLRIQTFELDIEGNQGLYKYELSIEHDEQGQKVRTKYERLSYNGSPLMQVEQGEMHLFRDDGSAGPVYPFDWTLPAVASIFPRPENKKLTWFKEYVKQILVIQVIPQMMTKDSNQEETMPSQHLENFVSWYRYLSQDQEITLAVTEKLRKVLPGFDYFRFEAYGEQNRLLKAFFSTGAQKIGYSFTDLSDGQRTLICLYTILRAAEKYHLCLCLDEPENFLALPEIQPWLIELYDLCQDDKFQALIISHHPEMINYLLASPVGIWFEREDNLVTRVKKIEAESNGLPVSELVARGWLNG